MNDQPSENSPNRIIGRHVLADIDRVAPELLTAMPQVTDALVATLKDLGFHILDVASHQFPGGGFTSIVLLGESHASIHTYPENGYLAFDLFSCGPQDPGEVLAQFAQYLGSPHIRQTRIERISEPNQEI